MSGNFRIIEAGSECPWSSEFKAKRKYAVQDGETNDCWTITGRVEEDLQDGSDPMKYHVQPELDPKSGKWRLNAGFPSHLEPTWIADPIAEFDTAAMAVAWLRVREALEKEES